MKKVLFILLIILTSISIYGCNNEEPEKDIFEQVNEQLNIPASTKVKLDLPKECTIDGQTVTLKWKTDNLMVMSYIGVIRRDNEDQTVKLTCTMTLGEEVKTYVYDVVVLAYTAEERLEKVMNSLTIPSTVDGNYKVPVTSNDSDVLFNWKFSHPNIFDIDGIGDVPSGKTEMVLTLTLSLDGKTLEKEFNTMAYKTIEIENYDTQLIIDRNFENGIAQNVDINNHLLLDDDKLSGTYLSPIVYTSPFTELVGSWSAIANQTTGSIEVSYRVLVEGIWSDFFTYGEWRFEDKNYGVSKTSSNGVARMSQDTIIPADGKCGNAYQYKIEFERDSLTLNAPIINLIATSFAIKDYEGIKLDYTKIEQSVIYDVPQLYQYDVPGIGGSICSPTSVTMLLKYKGHSFTDKGYDYEHEYIAINAKDYGNDIFGNWVYCTAVMGAHNEQAYVKYFANNDELIEHLMNVGPVSLSVKGNMQGLYNTGGHLLVCKGYKIEKGVPVFICNDPALKNVEVEYTYETIENVWRNVAYVIE